MSQINEIASDMDPGSETTHRNEAATDYRQLTGAYQLGSYMNYLVMLYDGVTGPPSPGEVRARESRLARLGVYAPYSSDPRAK